MINKDNTYATVPDDITEAYKKLRRLVMDYLGTSVPSPPESEHPDASCESPMTEAELTVTGGSANLGTTRTWSRPSIPDSISQQYAAAVKKSQTPTGGGRGVVVSLNKIKQLCFLPHSRARR